jgi:hypothetical protein
MSSSSTVPKNVLRISSLILAVAAFAAPAVARAQSPVIEFYNASTESIDIVQSVRLWWRVQGAVNVDIWDGWRNVLVPSLGNENYIEVWPERTSTYTLIATGPDGQRVTRDVTIRFAELEIEYFDAAQHVIDRVQPVRLFWRVMGARRVDIFDGLLNTTYSNLGNQNFIEVWPHRTATYTLYAEGPQGQIATSQVTVVFDPRNILDIERFVASPQVVERPQRVRLAWLVRGATHVELRDGFNGQVYRLGTSGSIEVRPRWTSTYTLVAFSQTGETMTRELTIYVNQPWHGPEHEEPGPRP